MQNGFIDSFNGRLRDELLNNKTLLTSLAQTCMATALWHADYNTARPHSQIAWQTPDEFAKTFTPRQARAALRQRLRAGACRSTSPTGQDPTPETNSALDKNWGGNVSCFVRHQKPGACKKLLNL